MQPVRVNYCAVDGCRHLDTANYFLWSRPFSSKVSDSGWGYICSKHIARLGALRALGVNINFGLTKNFEMKHLNPSSIKEPLRALGLEE